MDQKKRIQFMIDELKKDEKRWKNLSDFALSKLSEEQRQSPVFKSLLDLKIRQILSEYS